MSTFDTPHSVDPLVLRLQYWFDQMKKGDKSKIRRFVKVATFTPTNMGKALKFLRSPLPKRVREWIHGYFVALFEFGILVRLIKNSESKREVLHKSEFIRPSNLLRGQLVDGRIRPLKKVTKDEEFMALEDTYPVRSFQKLLPLESRWLRLSDREFDPLLFQLEELLYRHDAVSFLEHRTRFGSFLFCLIGRTTSRVEISKAAQVLTSYKQTAYKTGKRGRKNEYADQFTASEYAREVIAKRSSLHDAAIDLLKIEGTESPSDLEIQASKARIRREIKKFESNSK